MIDSFVELSEIPVMRVRADMKGKGSAGPADAMWRLESKLTTLKGRKFYGTFRDTPEGEEYFACVAMIDSDDPIKMQLEAGVIPGGKYARRKVLGWEKVIREGRLSGLFREMIDANDPDFTRPSIEYYRSQIELLLYLPVH